MADNSDLDKTATSARTPRSAFDYQSGQVVGGDYLLIDMLGRGGMSTVFSAEHRFIRGKLYALKILAREMITDDNLKRFQREAVTLAKLSHPGIVQVYNFGIDGNTSPYCVMELVEGPSLAELLAQSGTLDEYSALEFTIQVASALEYAHRHGIVHRDIKPGNLMLVRQKGDLKARVKIVDFGIVRPALEDERERQRLTATGDVFGTPLYMSPEQIVGAPVTFASDIYALGCTLFEMLTGRPPFKGDNAFATLEEHLRRPPPTLSAVSGKRFGTATEAIVARMLAKKAENRYASMQQLSRDLERALAGKNVYAAGLTGEELEQPLFEEPPAKNLSVADEIVHRPRVWLVPLLIFCLVVAVGVVAMVLFGKPPEVVKAAPVNYLDNAVNLVDQDTTVLKSVVKPPTRAYITNADTEKTAAEKVKNLHTSMVNINISSGQISDAYASAGKTEKSDIGKVSYLVGLVRKIKGLTLVKLSGSVGSREYPVLNLDDVRALEKLPDCYCLFLLYLKAPFPQTLDGHFFSTRKKLTLRQFFGAPPMTEEQSTRLLVKKLSAMPDLQWLDLRSYQLTDDDIRLLSRAPQLKVMELTDCQISNKAVEYLCHSKTIKHLSFRTQSFTPEQLLPLLKGNKLDKLYLREMSPELMRELHWNQASLVKLKQLVPEFAIGNYEGNKLAQGFDEITHE